MKTRPLILAAAVLSLTSAAAEPAEPTKLVYGERMTRAEFEELKQTLKPNPKWKKGEEGLRERAAMLKKRFASEGPVFAEAPPFDAGIIDRVLAQMKSHAATFHSDRGEIYFLLDPEPLVFRPRLKPRVVSVAIQPEGGEPVRASNLARPVYMSWSSEGVIRGKYLFELPDLEDVSEFDVARGEATVEFSLPKAFEVLELTREAPKKKGFVLSELSENVVRIGFDRGDAREFLAEVHTAEGKVLQSFSIGEDHFSRLAELVASRSWDQLPAEVKLPAAGEIVFGIVGPGHKVVLYRPTAETAHQVKSTWKRSF